MIHYTRIQRMSVQDDRDEIAAIRAELVEIAQAYNAAGTEILNRLYPDSYVSHGRMPGTLRSLEYAHSYWSGWRSCTAEPGSIHPFWHRRARGERRPLSPGRCLAASPGVFLRVTLAPIQPQGRAAGVRARAAAFPFRRLGV